MLNIKLSVDRIRLNRQQDDEIILIFLQRNENSYLRLLLKVMALLSYTY